MDDIYTFLVSEEEFKKILDGIKVAQIFVNDKKHNVYCEGNIIKFVTDNEVDQKQVQVEIESIMHFPTIIEAVENVGKEKCGFLPKQSFENVNDEFLSGDSYEQIEKFGVGVMIFRLQSKNK